MDQMTIRAIGDNGTIARQQRPEMTEGVSTPIGLDVTNMFEAPTDPSPLKKADLEALIPEIIAAHDALKKR